MENTLTVDPQQPPPNEPTEPELTPQPEQSAPVTPQVGDVVRVHVIENGVAMARLAYVTGSSSLDEQRLGESGEPYLTVVYLSNPDRRMLGSPDWSKAFTRTGPVHHGTAASVTAGRESVYWTDLLPDAAEAIDLPAMVLDTEAAGTVAAALAQRESHGQAGRGPVKDSLVPAQGATATDVVAQGGMAKPTPENPASVVAERINPPTARSQALLKQAQAAGRQRGLPEGDAGAAPVEGAAESGAEGEQGQQGAEGEQAQQGEQHSQ
jgi:hypothetical protein